MYIHNQIEAQIRTYTELKTSNRTNKIEKEQIQQIKKVHT